MPMLRLLVFMLVATVFLPARAAIECPDGLPVGVQLIGPRGDDGRLLRTARWLVNILAEMN